MNRKKFLLGLGTLGLLPLSRGVAQQTNASVPTESEHEAATTLEPPTDLALDGVLKGYGPNRFIPIRFHLPGEKGAVRRNGLIYVAVEVNDEKVWLALEPANG